MFTEKSVQLRNTPLESGFLVKNRDGDVYQYWTLAVFPIRVFPIRKTGRLWPIFWQRLRSWAERSRCSRTHISARARFESFERGKRRVFTVPLASVAASSGVFVWSLEISAQGYPEVTQPRMGFIENG